MNAGPIARILVVDDEAAQMTAFCDALRARGYEAIGFTDASASLAALQNQPFDLLLADLMMPQMNGIALLRAALALEHNLVGIIMTGQGTIDTAVEAMQSGALDYILKPLKMSVVLPVLSRALAVRRLRIENAALERRLRERTAELEAANKELEAFSFSVSHDLRAPVRAVHAFTAILLEEYAPHFPAEARSLLDRVVASARHMDQLIVDLLRFSRLGQQPLSRQPVQVSMLVQEVLAQLRQEEGDRHVEVHVGELPDCVADLALLRQVFVNLLSNAFKFSRRKAAALIEAGCRQEDGEIVYFVRDNGAGFDMRNAASLFGVFQRFHSAEEFEGNGVGLSIVKSIIERHGGRIWASAEVDKGAIFSFTLPGVSASPLPKPARRRP